MYARGRENIVADAFSRMPKEGGVKSAMEHEI